MTIKSFNKPLGTGAELKQVPNVMDFDKEVKAILAIAAEYPEGFTLWVPGLEMVTSGIAVAFAETQNCFGYGGCYLAYRHCLYNYGYLGGWQNRDGRFQFDSIRIFKDLRAAVKWGRKQKQYAIFDIDNGWEIVL